MNKGILAAAALAFAPFTFATFATVAEAGPIYVGVEGENIAVGGYDTVSYFQGDGVPVVGNATYTVEHDGAEWRFASAENAEKFKENPDAYAPRFGGHCAWAMARGSLAPGDPTVYKVVGGKLYLNFNKQVQTTWLKDIPGFIAKANLAWQDVPDDARFGG